MASIASLCLNRTTLAAITVTLDRASQAWIAASSRGFASSSGTFEIYSWQLTPTRAD
jgi:hypothetical protein